MEYINSDFKSNQEANKRKLAYRGRIVMWVGLIAVAGLLTYMFFVNVNKTLIRKDCLTDSAMSYNNPKYSPSLDYVEYCAGLGIEFAP